MKRVLSILAVTCILASCSVSGPSGGTVYDERGRAPSFRITSPKGGERFCMGEDVLIAWEGSSKVQTVRLELANPGTYRMIGDYPLNFKDGRQQDNDGKGEVFWPAGKLLGTDDTMGEGHAFQIRAAVYYKTGVGRDAFVYISDAVFSIVNCTQ